jgi:hypothetical protein
LTPVNASSLDPTANAWSADTVLTPARLSTPDLLGLGLGLATQVQSWPFQRRIKVLAVSPSVELSFPTAQASVADTARTPVSWSLAVDPATGDDGPLASHPVFPEVMRVAAGCAGGQSLAG